MINVKCAGVKQLPVFFVNPGNSGILALSSFLFVKLAEL